MNINDLKLDYMHGLKVHVQQPVKSEVKRSWKERLFSLPFRPFVSHRIEWNEVVEDGQVLRAGEMLLMNARTYDALIAKTRNIRHSVFHTGS